MSMDRLSISVVTTALFAVLVSGPVGAAEPVFPVKPGLIAPAIEKASKSKASSSSTESKAKTDGKKASAKRPPAANLLKDRAARIPPAAASGKGSATKSKVMPSLLKTPQGSAASSKSGPVPKLPPALGKDAMPKAAGAASSDKKGAGIRLPGSGLPKLPGNLEKAPAKPSGGAIGNKLPLPGGFGKQRTIAGDQTPQPKAPQLPLRPGGLVPENLKADAIRKQGVSAKPAIGSVGGGLPAGAAAIGQHVQDSVKPDMRFQDPGTDRAGADLQELMRVRREGARGTVRVREVRLENPRLARDRWKEWQPVVTLENTSRTLPAAVQLFVWGGTESDPSEPRRRSVTSLGWRILKPGQRLQVSLDRHVVTWTDCVRVWLGGRGARNPVRGTPDENTAPAGEVCKGDPPRWRVVVQADLMEVIHDGDRRSPTMWHMCLTLDQAKYCTQEQVSDGAKTIGGNPIAVLTVDKTYTSLRGIWPKAVFRVVDRDSFFAGGGDDIARLEILSRGLPFRSEPGDALWLRFSGKSAYGPGSGLKTFHRIGSSTEGPSGRLRYHVLYEPVE